ncbi:MAG TPA: carboxypeptidase-like regulatory domain-containing protein [Pirellulales bacterium]|nr:carboxypeptidase-like regulatory domain-containing protein [Pirellulales bacterium]
MRVWQKLPAPAGNGVSDQQVTFDGRDVLITDAAGRFASRDALVGKAFARVVAESKGMLAGRSGWIEVGENAKVAVPDIVLKTLRAVSGKVVDRQGQPLADVTVFNSGDGHQRAEATTRPDGAFLLKGIPEGAVFLFAEKSGYRFTGVYLPADRSNPTLTLATVDETVEPLTTLPALCSDDEENALVRRVLDPWLGDLAKSGSEREKLHALVSLVDFDPLEAFDHFREFNLGEAFGRDLAQSLLVERCIAHRGTLSWDELQPLIESSENHLSMTYQYVEATRQMEAADGSRRGDWLAQALLHARQLNDPAERTWALALVADGLFVAGKPEQAETVAQDAEAIAGQLPGEGRRSRTAFRFLALAVALAHTSPSRAMGWIEKIDDDYSYQGAGGELAVKLARDRPAGAEEMWSRTIERNRSRKYTQFGCDRYTQVADLCYAFAGSDRLRAERIALSAESHALRVRALGATALAIAASNPDEARRLLESIVRDELAKPLTDGSWFEFLAPSVTAAWLLPFAEKVEPELGREAMWRSAALRLPRPCRDRLDDGDVEADLATAMMLARYDRVLSRAILEPLAARLPDLARPALTELDSVHARVAAAQAANLARQIVAAAVHVDPRWAVELLECIPRSAGPASHRLNSDIREALVSTLGRHGAQRWQEGDGFCAGFWRPGPEVTRPSRQPAGSTAGD